MNFRFLRAGHKAGIACERHTREMEKAPLSTQCAGIKSSRPDAHMRGPRVRIPPPPAESLSLAGLYLRGSRTPAFRAAVPGCVPGAVGRDPRGPADMRQRGVISLSGPIPVPRFRRCSRDTLLGWQGWSPNEVGLPLAQGCWWILRVGSNSSKAERGPLIVPAER
jgi:hypothetical protein